MATDLDNSADFTNTNMKPEADDIIDATWGQNIAENTGYLYYKFPMHLASWVTTESEGDGAVKSGASGTLWFVKTPHSTMVGTISGTSNANDSGGYVVKVNGVQIVSENWSTGVFATSISHDISGLTNGLWYKITWATADFNAAGKTRASSNTLWGTTT